MPDYDALIIGSGPNGLAAGIHLARSGWRVKVIEGAASPGGGMRTKALTLPGFQHDVCSAVHPMGAASPFFNTLNLESHGLRWIHPEVPLAHPLNGGSEAVLHRSLEATAEGLGRDAGRYRLLFRTLVENAPKLYPGMLAPARFPAHPLLMARLGIAAGLPASVLARFFQTNEARALFAGNAGHSVMPFHLPLTSAIGVVLQFSAHAVGWPIPEGGSQSLADALVRTLKSHGGEIECGRPITHLDELPPTRAVLFDVSPKNLSKICGDALPQSYHRKLNAYRHGPGVFKVDYALNAPIPWRAEHCRKAGTVHVGGTFEEIAASERDAWEGRHTENPFVLVSQPTLSDPTRAPKGAHVAWAYCHVPHGSTENKTEVIHSQIERFAPGFRDTIMAAATMDCAQMEHYNPNYIGGDVVGGVTDWRQLFSRPAGLFNPYSTPNPKVFICSASTPPGGGVHGMCGYWAATAVIKKIRL